MPLSSLRLLLMSACTLGLLACTDGNPTDQTEAADTSTDEVVVPAEPDTETEMVEAGQPEDAEDSAGTNDVMGEGVSMGDLFGVYIDAGQTAPAVLIVPGSGPTNMDGNSTTGIQAAPYRLLAEGLATEGISTLRVDKRGMFGSADAGNPQEVTQDIYAQDYLDWATQLRSETGRDCVYLLGHSEGGQMVSAAAAKDSAGICGLILVSAPGRPLLTILAEQLQANPANAPLLDDALSAIAQLEAGETVDVSDMAPPLQALFAPTVQDYLISAYTVDPLSLVEAANVPTLVVQGDHDIQIGLEDALRLASGDAELVILPGVNHVLKEAPEERNANLATYVDPDLPLADSVLPPIVAFIKDNG